MSTVCLTQFGPKLSKFKNKKQNKQKTNKNKSKQTNKQKTNKQKTLFNLLLKIMCIYNYVAF